MASVTVEVADLSAAAREMVRTVADPLFDRVGGELAVLRSVDGMAGDDPPARRWAADYDRAAPAAIAAAEDVINACYRVSAMLAATARNYAHAEVASTVRGHPPDPAVAAVIATLPDDTRVGLPDDIPSACAEPGNLDLPVGWHYVAHHLGGYVWPNGHQDRLRRAAAAWHASAAALEGHAFDATVVDLGPLVDRLPEGPDIATVCNGLGDHLGAVARVHRELGHACAQLATHLDHAHARVRHELAELVAWTLTIQTVGFVAAVCTLGTAEAPTQAVQLARFVATGSAIADALRDFAAAVKTVALAVGPLADAAADIRAAVAWLREVRIVEVEVTAVPGLRVYQVARVDTAAGDAITTTEMAGEAGAGGRLSQASAAAERAARLRKMKQIESKFKHAESFGVHQRRGKEGFAAFESAIDDFLGAPTTRTITGTYRRSPAILHVNSETGLVVVQDTSGEFITGFEMTPTQVQRVEQDGALGLE